MKLTIAILMSLLTSCFAGFSQGTDSAIVKSNVPNPPPVFPMLLEKEALAAGNPLARYLECVRREKEYKAFPPLAGIYDELRLNFEQFLGVANAGKKALTLPNFRGNFSGVAVSELSSYTPKKLIDVIKKEATKTQIVIWGEEHHLPQTRIDYEAILTELWKSGYRYLAAEAFSEEIRKPDLKFINYACGFYIQDPVFANAVNKAIQLGYKLIDYDTKEMGPADDMSFRDRTQAENLKKNILDRDPKAKMIVIAGRGHASEVTASNGWTPMASVLKKITGIDPFTMFAPTMTERMTREEEHPLYTYAASKNLIDGTTIFVDHKTSSYYSNGDFDAYVFFPRTKLIHGRPDWLMTSGKRKLVNVFAKMRNPKGTLLVQAFRTGMKGTAVPVDQVLFEETMKTLYLALPTGSYWIRTIDANKNERIIGEKLVVK